MIQLLNWVGSITDKQQALIFLACILALGCAVYLSTRSLLVAIVSGESINIWNLTLYFTEWLVPEMKPFMPLWISILILIVPAIYLFVSRVFQSTDREKHKVV
jgi:hypothetical protein